MLVANNYPSTNLVFASMPHKNDFKNWWALFWKWPICWQWEMNYSMFSSVSKFWRWFQFWVGELLDVWNAVVDGNTVRSVCDRNKTVDLKWSGASVTGNCLPFLNYRKNIPVCTVFRQTANFLIFSIECGWWALISTRWHTIGLT